MLEAICRIQIHVTIFDIYKLLLLLPLLQGYLGATHLTFQERRNPTLPLLFTFAASKGFFHKLVVLCLCWYLATVEEVISFCVCVSNIVGIVAYKYQGLLYASNVVRVVTCWL